MPVALDRKLTFNPAPNLIRVLADHDKLKQVVINLVANAFEAVDPGETVVLSIQPDQANRVCIQVHNGGNPILPDVLPKLTKPFVTTKSNGTGLGLAIVKRIVEAHGGELNIESTAIRGTTITVELPTMDA
jgi:signal transduction histidine kinase